MATTSTATTDSSTSESTEASTSLIDKVLAFVSEPLGMGLAAGIVFALVLGYTIL